MISDRIVERVIAALRRMDVHEADRTLCNMSDEFLFVIAAALDLRLPPVLGDKPALVGAALRRQVQP